MIKYSHHAVSESPRTLLFYTESLDPLVNISCTLTPQSLANSILFSGSVSVSSLNPQISEII